jgi:hypothetical protein
MKVARVVARGIAVAGLVVLNWPSGSKAQAPSANVSVFATYLNNPRGLKFGPLAPSRPVADSTSSESFGLLICQRVRQPK